MEYLLEKEKELWNILYKGVNFSYSKKGKSWLVIFSIGDFSRGIKLKEEDGKLINKLDMFRKAFERLAIAYFIKQNK